MPHRLGISPLRSVLGSDQGQTVAGSYNNNERVMNMRKTGYIYNFSGHGAFSPEGKLLQPMTDEQIEEHNKQVERDELEAMEQAGRAVLYLHGQDTVGTWNKGTVWAITRSSVSRNNFGARRTDVWFTALRSKWHGVNIGDNEIVRAKRIQG